MKIYDTLRKTGAAVALSDFKKTDFGVRLKNAAVKAITNGITSPEWETYMKVFADNQAQLDLLSKPADEDEGWLVESRAYIVSNALCGAATTTRTYLLVDEKGLGAMDVNDAVDAAFVATKELTLPKVE